MKKPAVRKRASNSYLVDVLSKAQREQLELLICVWLATVLEIGMAISLQPWTYRPLPARTESSC